MELAEIEKIMSLLGSLGLGAVIVGKGVELDGIIDAPGKARTCLEPVGAKQTQDVSWQKRISAAWPKAKERFFTSRLRALARSEFVCSSGLNSNTTALKNG